MPFRQMGNSGLKVSAIGLGSWITYGDMVKDDKLINQIYNKAYDAGIRYYDTSSNYAGGEAERLMGRALQDFPRHTLVLSSKAYFPVTQDPNDRGLSRKHIMESVERSLRHLKTDYLDLFFCHRFDQETPLEETLGALDYLVHQGKVLYWGTSQWRGDQIRRMIRLSRRKASSHPQVEQVELNLFNRLKFERDTCPVAKKKGLGLVTFSPLASGMLTGKYDEGIPSGSRLDFVDYCGEFTEMHREKTLQLKALADKTGCTRAQLAICWCLAKPGVSSVITGATRVEQLEENLGALKVQLTDNLVKRLNHIFAPDIKQAARFHAKRHLLPLRDRLRG